MKKLILKALLTFTVLSMTLSPVFALDEVAPTNSNEITQKQIANISENDLINYVYLEETETTNSYENVVLSLKDEYKNASNAILTYTDSSNKSYQVNSSNQNDSEVLFKIENLTEGTYQLSSMTFEMDGNVYQSTFTSDYNASFSVVNGVSTQSLDNCDEEVEEYANDSSMKVVEATSLDEALDAVKSVKARSHNGNYVVYLDAGHDNTHTGARGVNGIKEETYTLAIAQACRDELQQYRNVEVHMCRDDSGSCPYPGTSSVQCNTNRVRDAASKGADLYIALHLNSANGSAHGAEVYVSNNSAYYSQGANLANKIVAQLKALGLSAHGSAVKVNAGANGVDKYTVIKHGVEHGINSMIVEHAFVDNYSDANYITNRYHDIGVADATAIANYLGLSKGPHVTLKGFTWQVHDDRILIGTAYEANTNVRFTFKSYNLDTKKWTALSNEKASNWQTWYPEKGNYWIYVEATLPNGYKTNQVMCFAVGKNYASYVNLNGFTWQMQDDRILIGSAYDTNDSGTQFSFKAYNLDTQKWETLSTFKSSNWQTWKPYKGNYWIYCQAKTSTGYTTDQVMCFAVGKDYGPYVHLNGYTWQMKSDSILVGSAYNTNDSDVKFTYKSYNLTTKQWQSLSDNSSSNWVTWKPERGNYWIYCQAKTSNGYTSDQTMCFAVSEDYSGNLYRIMGSSSITVDQMVKFYENGKGNATYDTFGESQYNGCLTQGGAPDIRTYCQIFKEEAENEGVKVEVAFTQAMLETGYLKFGGDVKPNQYNFAGIGATGNGNPGNSFGDVRTGIRAQIQHLKCYASTDSLNLAKVDPRWNNNLRGKAKYVEYLSIPNNPYGTGWAASATYGKDLLKLITNLYKC